MGRAGSDGPPGEQTSGSLLFFEHYITTSVYHTCGKKFAEGTGSMVLCWGSELFSGLRSVTRVHFCMCFHHTNFVCGSAIQVGIVIAVHRIYCIQYRYTCVYVLLDQRARARAASGWLNGQYA